VTVETTVQFDCYGVLNLGVLEWRLHHKHGLQRE
jgi:hypothetical protein